MGNNNKVNEKNTNGLLTLDTNELEYIINQMKNSVCKIKVKKENNIIYGSGFLCNTFKIILLYHFLEEIFYLL